eukprot:750930-Hanusia_phi.AAC.1
MASMLLPLALQWPRANGILLTRTLLVTNKQLVQSGSRRVRLGGRLSGGSPGQLDAGDLLRYSDDRTPPDGPGSGTAESL